MTTDIPTEWIVVAVLAAVWELAWKGLALWRASKRDDKAWFVVMLIVNTAGILPIIYLLMTREESAKTRA